MSDETEVTTEEVVETPAPPAAKPSESEAKLLKELMALKRKNSEKDEALKRFEGIDPDAVKALLAEKATREAEAEAAEEKRLKDAGEFETLQKATKEAHAREIEAERAKLKDKDAAEAKLQATIRELTVGSAFANSQFLRDETVLPPSKARRAYEAHFDVVDGRVIPYSKERGEAGREPLVDGAGSPLAFDAAMKAIVEADPDKEHLLKAKTKQGSGAAPAGGKGQTTPPNAKPSSFDILRRGLDKLPKTDK